MSWAVDPVVPAGRTPPVALVEEGAVPLPGAGGRAPPGGAVFLDKDGTLVDDVPYNVDPALLSLTRHAAAGLARLADAGWPLFLVTNQPGIATGRFSRADFARLEHALRALVRDEAGVELAGVYCCPHAPDASGRPDCLCRKPAPGLLRQAALRHGLVLERCWLIGDILDDVEAGHRAGCRSLLLDVGNETEWHLSALRQPDARSPDLLEAATFILAAGDARADPPWRAS